MRFVQFQGLSNRQKTLAGLGAFGTAAVPVCPAGTTWNGTACGAKQDVISAVRTKRGPVTHVVFTYRDGSKHEFDEPNPDWSPPPTESALRAYRAKEAVGKGLLTIVVFAPYILGAGLLYLLLRKR